VIARLRGTLLEKRPCAAVVEAGGVGYEVTLTLAAYEGLGGPGEPADLHVHTHVREDTLALFGFADRREKELFAALIAVGGVGPRTAIAALSGLGADGLVEAAAGRDARRLASVPGIGRKIAERVLLEKGDRIAALGEAGAPGGREAGRSTAGIRQDVISALGNLGYTDRAASEAVGRVLRTAAAAGVGSFESLLKESLRLLAR
jgi:Holliday junction DNA helicase RuvA